MHKKHYPIKLYLKTLPNSLIFVLSLVINVATWFWLFWQISPQDEMIFLHYNILFGVDYVGPRWGIALLPITGLVIIVFNAALGWYFYNKDKFISYLLNSIALLSQIFLLIAGSILVFLNV